MTTYDTTGKLAKLAELPLRNVTYWADQGVLRPAPGTNKQGHGRNRDFPISERKWVLLAAEFYRAGMILGDIIRTIELLRSAFEPASARDSDAVAAVNAYAAKHRQELDAQRSYWSAAVNGATDITTKPILYVLMFWATPSPDDLGFGVRTMGIDLNAGPTFDTTTLRALIERNRRIVSYNLQQIFEPLNKETP